jgi:dTDP-4-dehydrorhamnose reductase
MRILVIGNDSRIGGGLTTALLARGHNVIGTTRNVKNIKNQNEIFFDLASNDQPALPETEAAVVCAAMARFEECRNQPELAYRVNVEAPVAIANQLVPRGTHVLLLSTSAVFDCYEPLRKAESVRAPRSVYGRLKTEAESRLLERGQRTAVLRLTKVLNPEGGILTKWIDDLAIGEEIKAFEDHRFCPVPLCAAVDAIAAIIGSGETGLFQLSGANDISYLEAALHLASRLGRSPEKVIAVSAAANGVLMNEITPYTSLDTSRLSQMIGFVPPCAFDVIDTVYGPTLARAVHNNGRYKRKND